MRFKTEEAIWQFLTKRPGNKKFEALGGTIYANPDAIHDPNPSKTKAVRKIVRAIIENGGGEGSDLVEECERLREKQGETMHKLKAAVVKGKGIQKKLEQKERELEER